MPMTRTICSPASDSRSGPDDRDGPGDRRLVEQVHAGRGGDLGELGTGHGQQRLVGRDHRLALTQGRFDQFLGGVEPPDDLDDDVDIVAGDQRRGVGADEVDRDGHGPGPLRVGHGDPDELQADPGTGGHVLGAGEQDLGQRTPDIAAAEQTDAHGRSLVGVGEGAGLVGGHLQTVQGARTVTCPSACVADDVLPESSEAARARNSHAE